jgi:POT family proton-dependent oligopeptide transporter
MSKQPKALYLLNFVSMWECFSFYGMRALLVLYMVHALKFSDEYALFIYALYITLVELGGVVGGYVADRYLGLKAAIVLGGITIACGHIALSMSFFVGLGLIVLGTSFFRSNVAALVGHFYEKDDPRLARGYTLYYTGINVGGFLATIACTVVAEVYGWHAGLSLAAFGMLLGLIVLFFGRSVLIHTAPSEKMRVGKVQGIKRLGLYLLFLVLFYMCEEQLGSSLVLFGERHVDRTTLFGTIPAASLITFNPLTILLVGPFVSKIPLKEMTKIALSFLLLAASFLILYLATYWEQVPLFYAVCSIVLLSCGELLLGPTVLAAVADAVPKSCSGVAMGMVALGYSLANAASGFLSQVMSNSCFLAISTVAFCLALLLLTNRKKVFIT